MAGQLCGRHDGHNNRQRLLYLPLLLLLLHLLAACTADAVAVTFSSGFRSIMAVIEQSFWQSLAAIQSKQNQVDR